MAVAAATLAPLGAPAHDELPAHHKVLPSTATEVMRAFFATERVKLPLTSVTSPPGSAASAPCTGGLATTGNGDAPYPCRGIDLQSFLALDDIGGTRTNSEANDIWGWTAPNTREYAIVGRVFGTSFVDITDPTDPLYLGDLPTHGAFGSSWRDIKVDGNHAFIVSEALNHGMQVFDLMQLQDPGVVTDAEAGSPRTFAETAHYNGGASSHNLFINEDTHIAYMVGNSGKRSCSGGLHMVDISNPLSPSFAGCFDADGYTHDVQCVVYNGPDTAHLGKEICFASNEDTVTIVDVTDKANPVMLSSFDYLPGVLVPNRYTHQGWLSADHAYFIVDDELDEDSGVVGNTTTRILDVSDLDNPDFAGGTPGGGYDGFGVYTGPSTSIDHNLYMVGGCAVQANYRSGLRIVDLRDALGVPGASVAELAFFDIWPDDDLPQFNGMWSNYAFFPSGNIIASGIEQGLYVLKPSFDLAEACAVPTDPPPPTNTPPVVTITSPADGASFVEGTAISFVSTVTDAEDATDPTAVWSSVPAGVSGSGNSVTATPNPGTYVVTAEATDLDGAVGSASVTVIVTPIGGGGQMHVSGISGAQTNISSRRWTAEVTVVVEEIGSNAPVANATVSGTWSGGGKGGGSCLTSALGSCSVSKAAKIGDSLTFTVNDATHATLSFVSEADDHITVASPAP